MQQIEFLNVAIFFRKLKSFERKMSIKRVTTVLFMHMQAFFLVGRGGGMGRGGGWGGEGGRGGYVSLTPNFYKSIPSTSNMMEWTLLVCCICCLYLYPVHEK